jgi:hypothetical protein
MLYEKHTFQDLPLGNAHFSGQKPNGQAKYQALERYDRISLDPDPCPGGFCIGTIEEHHGKFIGTCGKIMAKSWEKMGISWENHGKIMGKNGNIMGN